MKKLYVYFETKPIGILTQNADLIYSFTYDTNWLKDPERFQLSLAIPFQDEPFSNKETLSFFENLLPEGDTRIALEKSQNIQGTFEFLDKFGRDCAGAISISQSQHSNIQPQTSKLVEISFEEIYGALKNHTSVAEIIAQNDPGFLSIAGAQDKFPAIFKDNRIYIPSTGSPTTHIVKVPIFRNKVKQSVYNEFFCMQLAKLVGLNVPRCNIVDHDEFPLYITERYDRRTLDGITLRIHQQDFCQAQGMVSEQKYEEKGGPTLRDNLNILKKHISIHNRSQAIFSYLDWLSFNFLIGNNDSHSKNLSLLLLDNKIQLAPFYDLLCTAVYPKLKRNFSFMIGDCDDASRIGINQFNMLNNDLELKEGTIVDNVLKMKELLLSNKDELVNKILCEFPQASILKNISKIIDKRCKSIIRQGVIQN